ncbi:MAG: alpha/beta fold hydrolase [Polynucleobacter sp.]|nr:alpha/beta fold hydrolase [Polynucleobacter sp.]
MSNINRIPYDWPNRQHSSTTQVGNLNWHIQTINTSPASSLPLILFLHGTGSSTHSWADLIPQLANQAQILIPDLPGHAFTQGAPIDGLKLEEIAGNLIQLIEKLKLPWPSMVVGHSAGAPLALSFAVQAPIKPRVIIGLNPSLIPPPSSYTQFFGPLLGPITKSATLASLLAKLAPLGGMIDRLLDSTNTKLPEKNRDYYRRLFELPEHVRGAMNFMASANIEKVLEESAQLPCKMIWVIGEKDMWVPEMNLLLIIKKYFPKSKTIHWIGGHIMHEVETQKTVDLILAELKA